MQREVKSGREGEEGGAWEREGGALKESEVPTVAILALAWVGCCTFMLAARSEETSASGNTPNLATKIIPAKIA